MGRKSQNVDLLVRMGAKYVTQVIRDAPKGSVVYRHARVAMKRLRDAERQGSTGGLPTGGQPEAVQGSVAEEA